MVLLVLEYQARYNRFRREFRLICELLETVNQRDDGGVDSPKSLRPVVLSAILLVL
jgi:hypothetical protein